MPMVLSLGVSGDFESVRVFTGRCNGHPTFLSDVFTGDHPPDELACKYVREDFGESAL
jgi:hypothetical protein